MHLLILGLILVVGILVYYIMTTSPNKGKSSDTQKSKIKRQNAEEEPENKIPENLRKEDNVIFLPNMNNADADGEGDSNSGTNGEESSDPDSNA